MSRGERVGLGYLLLFASLYAVQGVVYAYLMNFNIGFMVGAGVNRLTAQNVQSLALIPFILKFLAGPLSDRVNLFGFGHRRPFIVLGVIVQSLGLIGLSLVSPAQHLMAFSALAIFTVMGLALYDTCCDGMVVDVTPPGDRARVQAVLMVSRFVAATICAQGFGSWLGLARGAPASGYREVLWTCAGLGIVPLLLALLEREPERTAETEGFQWQALGVLIRPRSLALLAFGILYAMVGLGVEQNLPPYYESVLGIRPDGVGTLGAFRNIGRAVGALLLPFAFKRWPRPVVLAAGIVALGLTAAGQGSAGSLVAAEAWGFLFGMANGWNDALFYVFAMEASDPRMAASTYALFMAVTNLSVLGGSLVGAAVEGLGGYGPAFLAAGLVAWVALVLVPVLGRPAPAVVPEPEQTDVVAA